MKTLKWILPLLLLVISCGFLNKKEDPKTRELSEEFKKYWFENGAELSTYDLKQVRYGEEREGTAVMVFVTEPFEANKLVKADNYSTTNREVLKLNFIKKFTTGVYDYSMMTSDFFPLLSGTQALKVTSSSQEWCGHTFLQLLNRKKFDVQLHSYFESEGEQQLSLEKTNLEDDLFNQLRIDPNLVPTGTFEMIPSFFYLRLKHQEFKASKASANIGTANDSCSVYSLFYPELKRELKIVYKSKFPHQIISWKESYPESWTDLTNIMTTEAVLKKSMRLKYWEKHSEADSTYRKLLELE